MRPSFARMCSIVLTAALLILAACGGSSPTATVPPPASSPPVSPPTPVAADITILMLGNSHTVVNDLPETLASMVRAGKPGMTVSMTVAPGSLFLDERLADAPSTSLLVARRWSFVILQAQKYSTTGLFTYSTVEAQELVRRARAVGAVPVMFPEWPRLGVAETQRIYDVHVSIARVEPACVAPIGQAWELAMARLPALQLHAADGNHSAPAGAFLTALVLYATLTGNAPGALPPLPVAAVDSLAQEDLKRVAADTVITVPPRLHCPNDPY